MVAVPLLLLVRVGARSAAAGRAPSGSGPDPSALLSLRGIGKNFGPVQALSDITFDIPAGQVTALVGDNGAGKSTMIKTIAGIWEPNAGEIIWQGKTVHFHSPKDATNAGIATVYQDLALADNLDIVQNMMLGHEALKAGLLDEISMERSAKKTLADLRVTTSNMNSTVIADKFVPASQLCKGDFAADCKTAGISS